MDKYSVIIGAAISLVSVIITGLFHSLESKSSEKQKKRNYFYEIKVKKEQEFNEEIDILTGNITKLYLDLICDVKATNNLTAEESKERRARHLEDIDRINNIFIEIEITVLKYNTYFELCFTEQFTHFQTERRKAENSLDLLYNYIRREEDEVGNMDELKEILKSLKSDLVKAVALLQTYRQIRFNQYIK